MVRATACREFYCGENAIDELATELATRAAQQPAATVAAPQKQESAKPVLQAAEKTPAASDRETAVDSVTAGKNRNSHVQ